MGVSGAGCDLIDDWRRAQTIAGKCEGYELRRVDLALDVFDSPETFDAVIAAHEAGGFAGRGRPPGLAWTKHSSKHLGDKIVVGDRGSDKLYRAYEKGKQMLGPQSAARYLRTPTRADFSELAAEFGILPSDGASVAERIWRWWRHEVEFKPRNKPIPVDLIDQRDKYFAGAYPW